MATKESHGRKWKSKSGKVLVAAIHFGTTYSGYAFSFNHEYETDPTKVYANPIWVVSGCSQQVSLKTPTILLLDNKKQFVAFGFEAEERYSVIVADEEQKNYYYYRRFKMLLYKGDHLTRDVMIPDDKGRLMPALQVFSMSIEYLRNHLMSTVKHRMTALVPGDIHWVLTVPTIWNDGAKQFMREAAEKAGIAKESLSIALEPEAATLYCMNLTVDKFIGILEFEKNIPTISSFTKGTRYMVLYIGGRTVDITIYEVVDDGKLKELNYTSVGTCSGASVDAAFEKFLRSIVDTDTQKDKSVFDKFMQEAKEDWVDLFRDFETKKKKFHGEGDERSKWTINVPVLLTEIFKDVTGKKLKDFIKTKKEFADKVVWFDGRVRVETGIFRSWFDESCNNIVKHAKEVFKQKSSKNTNSILLVGGFSESPLLQDAIRKNFRDKRLIIPEEAGLAALKGAVIFGHNPETIVSRIARYSYGILVYREFQNGVHPANKKVTIDGKIKCKDVFDVHVKKGQELVVGKVHSKQRYTPLEADQISLVFDVYTSTDADPLFVTDVGCTYVGQLEVDVPDLSGGKDRGVFVQMIVGETEVVVEAREEKTNKITKAKFDFLMSDENASDSC